MATEIRNMFNPAGTGKCIYDDVIVMALLMIISFLFGLLVQWALLSSQSTKPVKHKQKQKDSDDEQSTDIVNATELMKLSKDSIDTDLLKRLVSTEERVKLVLIVRTDLEMSKGKAAAQCSHATLAAYKQSLMHSRKSRTLLKAWEMDGQPKITLRCQSEKDLIELYQKAKKAGLVAEYIQDAGRTQIAPGSKTVLALGPDTAAAIDDISGHLKLY